jgi:hypothetical protein
MRAPEKGCCDGWLAFLLVIGSVTHLVSAVIGLLNGEWASGIKAAGAAILLAFLAYSAYRWLDKDAHTPPSPPPAPSTPSSARPSTGNRGSDHFKKCPACG